MLYKDIEFFQTLVGGSMAEPSIEMNIISQGVGNGFRQGTKVKITGFEFRFVVSAIVQSYVSQATYSWAGTPGLAGTTRTVPAIEVPASTTLCEYEDSNGAWANSITNYDQVVNCLAAPSVPGPYPITGFVGPAAVCGSSALPVTDTNLAYAKTNAAVTLQAQQVGVINQPAFPVLPSWSAPTTVIKNGADAGKLPSFRVMVFWDRYGMDADYALGPVNCSWFDILENSGIYDKPPTVCMYNMKNLSRFEVLYDVTWHPPTDNSEMMIVCPPKELCDHITVYDAANSIAKPITSGVLYFALGASDNFQVYPPTTYRNMMTGVFRVFYEDH